MSKLEVYNRDGKQCWYCGIDLTFEQSTTEHLLATAHGGSKNNHNMTIACSPCNAEAGDLPIVEKVALRELKRQIVQAKLPKSYVISVGDVRIEVSEANR